MKVYLKVTLPRFDIFINLSVESLGVPPAQSKELQSFRVQQTNDNFLIGKIQATVWFTFRKERGGNVSTLHGLRVNKSMKSMTGIWCLPQPSLPNSMYNF